VSARSTDTLLDMSSFIKERLVANVTLSEDPTYRICTQFCSIIPLKLLYLSSVQYQWNPAFVIKAKPQARKGKGFIWGWSAWSDLLAGPSTIVWCVHFIYILIHIVCANVVLGRSARQARPLRRHSCCPCQRTRIVPMPWSRLYATYLTVNDVVSLCNGKASMM
jgi:hypothetical protein